MMQAMNSSSIKSTKIVGLLLASIVLALVICQIEARRVIDEEESVIGRHIDERPHVLDKRASDKDSSTTTSAPKERKKKTKRPRTTTTQSPDDDDVDPTQRPRPSRRPTTTKVPDSKSTTSKPSSSTTKPDSGRTTTTTTSKPNSRTSTTKASTRSDDKDFDDLMHRQREEKIALEHLNAGLYAWKRALEKNDRVLNRISAGEFFKNLISLRKVIKKSDVVAMIREYTAYNSFTTRKPWTSRNGGDDDNNGDKPESLDY